MQNTNPPPLPPGIKPKKKNRGCLWAGIAGGAILLVLIVVLSKLFSGGTPINARAFIDEDATSYVHLTDTTDDAGIAEMTQHIISSFQRMQWEQSSENRPKILIWIRKLQQMQQRSKINFLKAPQVLGVTLPTDPDKTKERNYIIVDLNTMPRYMSGMISIVVNQIYKNVSRQNRSQLHRGVPLIASSKYHAFTSFHKKVFLMATEYERLQKNIDILLDKPVQKNTPFILQNEVPGDWDITGAAKDIELAVGLLDTNAFKRSITTFTTEKLQKNLQRVQGALDVKSADEISVVIRINCTNEETAKLCQAILEETLLSELQEFCKKEMLTLTTDFLEPDPDIVDIHLEIKGLKPWIGRYIFKLNQTM